VQIFKEKAALERAVSEIERAGKSIGFVPTMGALHQGHLSLVKQAAKACEVVVVSIFINPTQFENPSDLQNYPRTLEADIMQLEELKLDLIIFAPNASELYGKKIEAERFFFDGLENQLEGKFRAGHFDGVGTVVKKLFEIVKPSKAFFGEKDYQQLQIVRKLTEKSKLPVEIIGCPIERETNGLARSSRNERLSLPQREKASFIYNILLEVKEKFGTERAKTIKEWVENEFQGQSLLKLEYFEIADGISLTAAEEISPGISYRAFIAAYAGEIRLIDNIALN
jgi:pantoate--beta-alanine ligase